MDLNKAKHRTFTEKEIRSGSSAVFTPDENLGKKRYS